MAEGEVVVVAAVGSHLAFQKLTVQTGATEVCSLSTACHQTQSLPHPPKSNHEIRQSQFRSNHSGLHRSLR